MIMLDLILDADAIIGDYPITNQKSINVANIHKIIGQIPIIDIITGKKIFNIIPSCDSFPDTFIIFDISYNDDKIKVLVHPIIDNKESNYIVVPVTILNTTMNTNYNIHNLSDNKDDIMNKFIDIIYNKKE